MTHLDTELKQLKTDLIEMWELVLNQCNKAHKSIIDFDKDLASDIAANEKRVDAFELKINMDCENILALFNPVANDLRFVLAVLKITYNLERIGDYAKSIAKLVNEAKEPFEKQSLEEARIDQMFCVADGMLGEALEAFIKEDVIAIRQVFKKDDELDFVNKKANKIIAGLITRNPKDIENALNLLSIIRKLERVGDQTKNIAEEIVFYIEAKILRHKKKKEKLGES